MTPWATIQACVARLCSDASYLWWIVAAFGATYLFAFAGFSLSTVGVITRSPAVRTQCDASMRECLTKRLDAYYYIDIAENGYSSTEPHHPSFAYFPGYPMAVAAYARLTGLGTPSCALLVSNVAFLCALIVLWLYVQLIHDARQTSPQITLFALSLWPTAFFFIAGYSESLFLLLAVWSMLLLQSRQCPLIASAMVIGVTTAIRPIGPALVAALVIEICQRKRRFASVAASCAILVPLSCSGLIMYMIFQYMTCGMPVAFLNAQFGSHFRPPVSMQDRLIGLATFEPIWSVYNPLSSAFYRRVVNDMGIVGNLQYANPLLFVLAAALICAGISMKRFTAPEAVYSIVAIGLPYVTRGYDMAMASQARYAMLAFPMFIAYGSLVSRLPKLVVHILALISGLLMASYAGAFAAGYFVN